MNSHCLQSYVHNEMGALNVVIIWSIDPFPYGSFLNDLCFLTRELRSGANLNVLKIFMPRLAGVEGGVSP